MTSGTNIIVTDQLTTPPTWTASFRDLTLFVTIMFGCHVLIESENPDPYYVWLKKCGGMDFVKDFIRPGSESGIYVESTSSLPTPWKNPYKTIFTDRIIPENLNEILLRIKFLLPR